MKAIDATSLQSILDSELVWRRREISALISASASATFATQRAIVRATIPLLYAHWEGFGKECGVRYLEFVSYRRLKFSQLKPAFIYMKMYPVISEIIRSESSTGIDKMKIVQELISETNKDPFKKRINTRSNLRWDVLSEILSLCGIPCDQFEAHAAFINEELCDPRNEIAHGRSGAPSLEALMARRDQAFELMTELQTTFVNAALSGSYRSNPPP